MYFTQPRPDMGTNTADRARQDDGRPSVLLTSFVAVYYSQRNEKNICIAFDLTHDFGLSECIYLLSLNMEVTTT